MNIRDMILEALNGDSEEHKVAMLEAADKTIMEYATRDMSELLDVLKKVDIDKLDGELRKKFVNILGRIIAIELIGSSTYDNISISESQGVEIIRDFVTGIAKEIKHNEKKSCQISLWSGMGTFEIDPKKMET